jgi:hypothetical protein
MWLKRKLGEKYTCIQCGDKYPLEHPSQLLCSPECRKKWEKERKRIFHQENREDALKKQKIYFKKEYVANKEKYALKSHEYYLNNKDDYSKRKREYYLKNKEKIKERNRQRYLLRKNVLND